MEMKTKYI